MSRTALAQLSRSLEHDSWANRRVLEELRAQASAPALRIFAHLLAAGEVWLQRLRGEDEASTPIWPDLSLEDCVRQLTANEAGYRAFLAALTGEELDGAVSYRNNLQTSVGDILTHLASHGAYHRGQIALLLRQAGLEPVNTDFITWVREQGSGRIPAS